MDFGSSGVLIALLITAAIAFWAVWKTKRQATSSPAEGQEGDAAYFTARGMLSPGRLFFSVFATTFSAFTVVGLPAMFYAHGIWTFIWMGVGIGLTPFTLHFIGKRIIERGSDSQAGSVIGLMMEDYDSRALMLILSILTVIVLFPYLTLQIAGIGKFLLSTSDGGISYMFGAGFVCALVGLYVATGGAAADAETDFIQGPILLAGTLALGAVIIFEMAGSFGENMARLDDAGLLSLPGPRGYFTGANLISFGIIFTLISISTPQVSQRLMGASSPEDLKPIIKVYAPVGLIVVALAGLMGLYAASNLDIATPDFVAGDVLRSIAVGSEGPFKVLLFVVAILFITAVISAAVSTIDSVLIGIAGIASDNLREFGTDEKRRKLKPLSWIIVIVGLIFASNPPTFITDLAAIQLSGLTALLPCLFGPLFGYTARVSGWASLILGLLPILAARAAGVDFWGVDPGVIGLGAGIVGLQFGRFVAAR